MFAIIPLRDVRYWISQFNDSSDWLVIDYSATWLQVLAAGRIQEYDEPYVLLQNRDGLFYHMVQQTGAAEAASLLQAAKQVRPPPRSPPGPWKNTSHYVIDNSGTSEPQPDFWPWWNSSLTWATTPDNARRERQRYLITILI